MNPPAEAPPPSAGARQVLAASAGPFLVVLLLLGSAVTMAGDEPAAPPVEEPEGLGLPLWQIEVAVGGLLAVLVVIALRGWRRTGRETD